jgi:hypothetical protein
MASFVEKNAFRKRFNYDMERENCTGITFTCPNPWLSLGFEINEDIAI